MTVNPIAVATRAKGLGALLRRAYSITRHYGVSPAKMDAALQLFVQTLDQFNCGASFAVTALVLKRNPGMVKYRDQNIELVVHGYTHADYSHMEPAIQQAELRRACEAFASIGLPASGFRPPYLLGGPHLYASLEATGFSFVSSQPIIWDVLDAADFTPSTHVNYERAVAFYHPWLASERLSLPRFCGQLIEIPVSLPDDEILADRLQGDGNRLIERVWQRILSETYSRGELFTVQLHPERIKLCVEALSAILGKAHASAPPVWIARLGEIDAWWRARSAATVDVQETGKGAWRLSVTGPPGTTILARGVQMAEPVEPWADHYGRVTSTTCNVRAACRPLVGVSPTSPAELISFLRQQGYIVLVSRDRQAFSIYLDQTDFSAQDERPILAQIEESARPLVRLGRWPNGARSALCISGDVDALTLGDYGLRLFGK
jgi:peptidoglycan/xylan/chitin deacetylase (PgdA/CDA1 family)